MRHFLLLCGLLLPSMALAQKPPPLGAPSDAAPAPRRDGVKPPPLGRPDGAADRLPNADEHPTSSGTGFIVADGRLLTNHHVIADCNRVTARNAAGRRVPVHVDTSDADRDLALLTVPAGFGPALTFREAPPVRRGETVVTFGFPLSGLLSSGPTLTTGDVSALSGLQDNPINYQISAPVQPGNSGGPLLDAQGNVMGVVVSKLNAARIARMIGGDIPQNVNFAVKGSIALGFLRENHVQVRTATSEGPDKRAQDVGDLANPSTVYLQCY